MQVVGKTRSVLCLQKGSSREGVSSRECRRCAGEDEDALFMENLQSEKLQSVAPLVHEQPPAPPTRPCVDACCKAPCRRAGGVPQAGLPWLCLGHNRCDEHVWRRARPTALVLLDQVASES